MSTAIQAGDVIRSGESYPLPAFKRITGLGAMALREARKKGLTIRRVGTRSFVLGSDWLTYLQDHAATVGPDGAVVPR